MGQFVKHTQYRKKGYTLLDEARGKCVTVLGVLPSAIYFTSDGTESDHIALLLVLMRQNKGTVLISAIEYPTIRAQS